MTSPDAHLEKLMDDYEGKMTDLISANPRAIAETKEHAFAARTALREYLSERTLTEEEAAMALTCIEGHNFTFSAPNLRAKLNLLSKAEPR